MSKVRLTGATSGYTELAAAATAGNNELKLPASGAGSLIATSDTGTVSTAMVADSAISSAKIANGAVDSSKLADASITAAKLSTGGVGTGVGYVRDGAYALSGADSYGHFTFQAPNGGRILMQWGISPVTSTSAATSVNFHTSFAGGTVPQVTAVVTGIAYGSFVRVVMLTSVGATSFSYHVRDQTTTTPRDNGIRWLAVGEAP